VILSFVSVVFNYWTACFLALCQSFSIIGLLV
jgi:hypothetical protein